MSTEQQCCKNCRFFDLWDVAPGMWHPPGECRRYPPPNSPKVTFASDELSIFPRVSEVWWCGEFQPKGEPTA